MPSPPFQRTRRPSPRFLDFLQTSGRILEQMDVLFSSDSMLVHNQERELKKLEEVVGSEHGGRFEVRPGRFPTLSISSFVFSSDELTEPFWEMLGLYLLCCTCAFNQAFVGRAFTYSFLRRPTRLISLSRNSPSRLASFIYSIYLTVTFLSGHFPGLRAQENTPARS